MKNSSRYGTIQEPHRGRSKIFMESRSKRMEHITGLVGSFVFIVLVVFGVWYVLTLSERGEPTDE